jgi:hypothetical protein
MGFDEAVVAAEDHETSDVSLDHLAAVLRDVLALPAAEGLAFVVQTQVARVTSDPELTAAA